MAATERMHGSARSSRFSLSSLAVGGGLMYFLDPERGRRRRALARDRIVHLASAARRFPRVAGRDFGGRLAGLWAIATGWPRRPTSDETLERRVRTRLGRIVSHPHAVRVSVHEGIVTLRGPILTHEVGPLIAGVLGVAGVRDIDNQLQAHERGDRVSSLQGGVPRGGNRLELMQEHWSPTARVMTGGLGAGLLAYGMRARGPLPFVLALAGGALLVRAVTNRDLASVFGVGGMRRPISIDKTIHINAPVKKVFDFWNDFENFPLFMSRVQDVRRLDERRTHWVVAGPAGVPVEWTAEITRLVPEQRIEWRADERSTIKHWGCVHFDPAGPDSTRIQVQMRYLPPAGMAGHALAALLGADPKREMDADLLRMKSMLETGHIPHDAAALRRLRRTGENAYVAPLENRAAERAAVPPM
ncbi:MAG TPA: SRPBCC family protein [Burkholderiaceae bacterium]|nr:SRPBCC family protein [Burkholderiaceae bacterium]